MTRVSSEGILQRMSDVKINTLALSQPETNFFKMLLGSISLGKGQMLKAV